MRSRECGSCGKFENNRGRATFLRLYHLWKWQVFKHRSQNPNNRRNLTPFHHFENSGQVNDGNPFKYDLSTECNKTGEDLDVHCSALRPRCHPSSGLPYFCVLPSGTCSCRLQKLPLPPHIIVLLAKTKWGAQIKARVASKARARVKSRQLPGQCLVCAVCICCGRKTGAGSHQRSICSPCATLAKRKCKNCRVFFSVVRRLSTVTDMMRQRVACYRNFLSADALFGLRFQVTILA